jgi:hypothetical protein
VKTVALVAAALALATPTVAGETLKEILNHPPATIAGIGAISCETFADMTALVQAKDVTEAAVFDWAQGWMSGANDVLRFAPEEPMKSFRLAPKRDLYAWTKEQQLDYIRNYCSKRQDYMFVWDAVSELFKHLPPDKSK